LRFEPRSTGEAIAAAAMVLAAGGVGVLALGALSAAIGLWRGRQFGHSGMQSFSVIGKTRVFDLVAPGPALLVTGVWRSRLLISQAARQLLTKGEMEVAIRHELSHVSRSDNLKKLAFRLCRFPFLGDLERKWLEATELAADDAAVTDAAAAVDLAAAVLKMAANAYKLRVPDLTMSLSGDDDSALRARVERLLAWTPRPRKTRSLPAILGFAAAVLAIAISYPYVLVRTHELTELLFR
jgi:beta-lactamase regulating signal transducer with metallopeptidase domain